MLNRPLILKLIALLLCLDPLLRMIFISIERKFSFSEVFFKVFELGFIDFFNFMFLFPISGLLLLSANLFSYITFFLVQAYSLYFHFNYESFSWPYLSESPSASAYFLLTLNILMILYFIFPRSREIFFRKDLRWWERGTRYTINEKCQVVQDGQVFTGVVKDLSFGGALVTLDRKQDLETGDKLCVDFRVDGQRLSLESEVTRIVLEEGIKQYGVQFCFSSTLEKYKLKILMFAIGNRGLYEKYR